MSYASILRVLPLLNDDALVVVLALVERVAANPANRLPLTVSTLPVMVFCDLPLRGEVA